MRSVSETKPIEILLVEDNPGDVRLTREGLSESKIMNTLHAVDDGVDAMAYLKKQPPFTGAARPDLIMMDLNLPRMDGRELLAKIKADENLRRIPVVVLTTSEAEEDIFNAYDLHANCYITKPVDLEKFIMVVNSIENFWFTIVKLPEK